MERRKPKSISGRRTTDIPVRSIVALENALLEKVAEAVKITVNGKIDKIDHKLDEYIAGDIKWKADQEAKTGPAVKAYRQGSDFFIVIKALIGFLVLIGGAILAWASIKSKIL